MNKLYVLLFAAISFQQLKAQDTIDCSVTFNDTVKYVMSKVGFDYSNSNSSLALIGMNNNNDPNFADHGYTAYGTAFEAPEPVVVKGAAFYGIIYSGPADSVWVRMYNMVAGMPDTVIDEIYMPLNYQPGYSGTDFTYQIANYASFPNQPTVSSDYMIAIENHSSKDYYITRTANGTANSEGLGYTYYEGVSDPTYDGWYHTIDFGSAWEFDFVIEPVVEYNASTEIIVNSDSLCEGDSLIIDYSVVIHDTAIFYNKFYNADYSAFADSFAVNNAVDYNDGNGFVSDLSYLYSSGGNYNLQFQLTGAYPFWSMPSEVLNCTYDVYQSNVTNEVAVTDTMCLNETAILYPGDFESYAWNTGQLTDSILIGPFSQPDSIAYIVDVNDGLCSGSYTYPVFVDNCVGVEEVDFTFEMYPNPASTEIYLAGDFPQGTTVQIVNVTGQMVANYSIYNNQEVIDVSNLNSGFYTLSLNAGKRILTKKIQIVR